MTLQTVLTVIACVGAALLIYMIGTAFTTRGRA